jgi:multiple sugar transport system permease protein
MVREPFSLATIYGFPRRQKASLQLPKLHSCPLTFIHFYNIFVIKKFHVYLLNSIIVAGTATLLCTLFSTLTAFALARLRVRYRFGILGLILTVSMFPQIAIVGPLYLIASQLGLLDTYVSLIIIYLTFGLPLMIWVLFGYFSSIPRERRTAFFPYHCPFRCFGIGT